VTSVYLGLLLMVKGMYSSSLSTIFQLYRGLAVYFIGSGKRRTRRKPPTCRKSL